MGDYHQFMSRVWRKPTNAKTPKIMDTGILAGISMSDMLAAADARPAPSATDRLQRNLERTVSESTARAEVLRQEIAAREAELADVLRAEEAARMGLEALDDRVEEGPFPADEPTYLDPHPVFPFGRAGDFSPITDEDLSAACGRALEAEDFTLRADKNGH